MHILRIANLKIGNQIPQQNHILKGICNCMPKVENFLEIRDSKENTWEIHDGWVIITRVELHLEKMGSSPFIFPPAQYYPYVLFYRFFFKIPPTGQYYPHTLFSRFKCMYFQSGQAILQNYDGHVPALLEFNFL